MCFRSPDQQYNKGEEIPFWMKTLSGMGSGAIAVTIGTPMDVALVRMQSDSMKPKAERRNYKHVIDALRRCAAEEGLGALYAVRLFLHYSKSIVESRALPVVLSTNVMVDLGSRFIRAGTK